MRSLNSPPVLNALEAKIVEATPSETRHILVINAGDGRLARAIVAKAAAGAAVSVVTLQPGLRRFVDDFEDVGENAWKMDWYAARVAKHGVFDYVVFYQLHEFWGGELHLLLQVIKQVKPGALVWGSFLNAQSIRMITRFMPPVALGFASLVDPVRSVPALDYASYSDLIQKWGGEVREVWAMLDLQAQEFCQKNPLQPAEWDIRGVKFTVGTLADAFLWGAPMIAMAFQTPPDPDESSPAARMPAVSYSPYSVELLQALVLPYPDEQGEEGAMAAALLEVESFRRKPLVSLAPLAEFFIKEVGGTEQPRRVLLMGSSWGRDLLLLKRKYPSWEWVGFDHHAAMVELGRPLLEGAGCRAATADLGAALPFEAGSFDLALSLGYFSALYAPAAKHLAGELRRVVKGSIRHLEDGRGPAYGLHLKNYSLKQVYAELGADATIQPVLMDGGATGMQMLTVAGRP
jgi:hypothetical protein